IDERGLQGRVARYYPESHQLFVNLTYSAVVRMTVQLCQEFEAVPDPARVAKAAAEIAEWAITRKVARALVFTLGKREAGWAGEDTARAQSPESLSIVADDHLLLLPAARGRLANALGVAVPSAGENAVSPQAAAAQRAAGELADAQQAVRRALATPTVNAAPFLRRLSELEARRRNMPAALDWAEHAVAADPQDARSYAHLAGLLQQSGDLDRAEATARQGMSLNTLNPVYFLRLLSNIFSKRRDFVQALSFAEQAVAAEPTNMMSHLHIANLQLQTGDLDAAERASRKALELSPTSPTDSARFLILLSRVAQARNDLAGAIALAEQAVVADPQDASNHGRHAELLMYAGELDHAEASARRALTISPETPAPYLRLLGIIERQRKRLPEAINLMQQAIAANPLDASTHKELSVSLLLAKNLDGAEREAREALALAPTYASHFLRLLSTIAQHRQEMASALDLAQQSVAADPNDSSSHFHFATLLMLAGDLDRAEREIEAAIQTGPANRAAFLKRASEIKARQLN
ncbi:MAG: tetratricopeptide repeat protein, partial [Rhodospirillales bacterium]|nr:tetratricopeptide repeat protein [Acetobacter sp.]